MKVVLRTETPVHVGDGGRLSWLDYHLHGRTLHVLDWGAILEAASLGCDDVAERLRAFCDRCHRIILDAQRAASKAPGRERSEILRRARDQTSPVQFASRELGNDVLARAIRAGDYDRYRADFHGGRLDRRLEIVTQAKGSSGPTIPASSLRGQIRSALLHVALGSLDEARRRRIREGGAGLPGWDASLEDATPGRARFLFGHDLECAAFRCESGRGRSARADDPRFDLMRFIRISEPLRSRANLVVLRASPFVLKKERGPRGSSTRAQPVAPVMMEAIDAGAEFEYEIRADAALLKGVASAEGAHHPMLGEPFWDGFTRVFGLTRDEVRSLDEGQITARVVSAVEVALAARMSALLERESRWCDRVGLTKDSHARAFLAEIARPTEAGVALRVGFGSGWLGLTAVPALESDPQFSEPLARIVARVGLGLSPRARRERAEREKLAIQKAREQRFLDSERPRLREDLLRETRDLSSIPITRRIVMEGAGPADVPGYARLRRGEMSDTPPATEVGTGREPDRPDGDRRKKPRRPRRQEVPDRPATQSEIESLLKKFGPRHER